MATATRSAPQPVPLGDKQHVASLQRAHGLEQGGPLVEPPGPRDRLVGERPRDFPAGPFGDRPAGVGLRRQPGARFGLIIGRNCRESRLASHFSPSKTRPFVAVTCPLAPLPTGMKTMPTGTPNLCRWAPLYTPTRGRGATDRSRPLGTILPPSRAACPVSRNRNHDFASRYYRNAR